MAMRPPFRQGSADPSHPRNHGYMQPPHAVGQYEHFLQSQAAQMVRQDGLGAVMNQFPSMSLGGGPMPAGSGAHQHLQPHPYYAGADAHIAYTAYGPVSMGNMPQVGGDGYGQGSVAPQYPMNGLHSFGPIPVPYLNPYTPGRGASYGDRNNEVPPLEQRRGSYSTTESTPATPYFANASDRGNGGRVAVRSAYNTPSPDHAQDVAATFPKVAVQEEDLDMEALLKEEPAIPRAVPAVFTPAQHMKTLEQCLENRIVGNRNVYIRGLHPTTDDDLLLKYAQRFGEVEQSKAIIDTGTGACKGFGFAKFADVRNSERCIRGFYSLGYEVGFARVRYAKESFNARLKAEGDESSTNLYLSNLPKRLTESELNAIFVEYRVLSSKILRDSMGNSRGVGFARFESRDECKEVIRKYHGMAIGEEQMCMQVRYADTPSQKELKRVTAERRQFRTNEYNIGAYGTADVGIHPSIYAPQPAWRGPGRVSDSTYTTRSSVSDHTLRSQSTDGGNRLSNDRESSTTTVSIKTPDSDGSDGEGTTIVDKSAAVNLRTKSSPAIKHEKA